MHMYAYVCTFSDAGNKISNIFTNNCFTSYNRALFLAANKVKKEKQFKYLWLSNSRLLKKKTENDRPVVINTFEDLADLSL